MSVKHVLHKWYQRHLDKPEAVVFILFLLIIILILVALGDILLPLIIAIVLAYLLEWPVTWLRRCGINRTISVLVIFTIFISLMATVGILFIPVLKQQLAALIHNLPDMFAEGKKLLISLKNDYPNYITNDQVAGLVDYVKNFGQLVGQNLLSFSINSIGNILTVMFYLFLVPMLAFFLLKDKELFIKKASAHMPEESSLIYNVWNEVHIGLGNYIRGKFLEAFILTVVTYVLLISFGLQYAALLSVLVGLSIFFPYIGAIIVTIPIAIVGLFQMGLSSEFMWLMVAYLILQILDGNVLATIIFSEAINMHPIVIILAIMLFGGLFGFWGVFFAIPLAILVKAVINLWPSYK